MHFPCMQALLHINWEKISIPHFLFYIFKTTLRAINVSAWSFSPQT